MKTKYTFYLILLLISSVNAIAQNYSYKGRIIDTESRKPLPFVAISIVGEHTGVQTDIDGKFKLVSKSSTLKAKVQYVGYITKEVELRSSDDIEIQISQKENIIKEVQVVAGENPAHRIIRKVIDLKDKNNPEKVESFRYTSYNKFVFTGKYDSLIFKRREKYQLSTLDSTKLNYQFKKDSIIQSLRKKEKSADSLFERQHLFITETVTQRDFLFPDRNKEKIQAVKISGLKNPMFTLIASQFQSFSFYKDYMTVLDKNYLSPISKGSISKYFFNIEDTLLQNNDSVFVISFKPRKGKNFDGLSGLMYINTDGYALQNVIAEPTVSSYFKIKIQQQYEKIKGYWFPTQLNTDLDFNGMIEIGNRTAIGIGRTYIKDVEIGLELQKKKFDGVVLDYDQKSIKNNSDSIIIKNRVDTLDIKEKQTYYVIDSIGKAEKLDQKLKAFDILSKGYIPYKYIQFDIKRILSGYNDYEGLRLGLGIGTSEKFSKYFSVDVYGAWGTKDNKFKYGSILKVPIYLQRDIAFEAIVSKDVIESGSTLFRGDKKTNYDRYRNILVRNMDWQEGGEAQISIRSQKYIVHYLYASQYNRKVTNLYAFDNGVNLQSEFKTQEIGISTRWAYKENFMRQSKQRISMGTKYPVVWFNISYLKGMNLDWTSEFYKLDFKLKKSFLIRNGGTTHLNVYAGYINKSVPYPFAYNGRANFNGRVSLVSQGYFETMRMNEFLSTEFAAFFINHDFAKLLYKGERFKPGVSISTAYGIGSLKDKTSHFNINYKTMEKGYWESGITISDLFVLKSNLYNMGLGVGTFYRYGAYRNIKEIDNLAFKLNFSISF